MELSRRQMLQWGAVGAAGAALSSAASSVGLPSMAFRTVPGAAPDPLAPLPAAPQVMQSPRGINPGLFQRAKAALDSHRIAARDTMGIVDFSLSSNEPRFHVVDLRSGQVESYRVAHGEGSDPAHCGYLERFSNDVGSYATSNGTYVTGDYYQGKYGLSMRTLGLDPSNSNAEARAIVIHNAWYAEPDMIVRTGKLGRSQGCFTMARKDQWEVMRRLGGGRMVFAEKIA